MRLNEEKIWLNEQGGYCLECLGEMVWEAQGGQVGIRRPGLEQGRWLLPGRSLGGSQG